MTYGELKTSIQGGLEYDETTFIAELPNIVTRSEQRIFRDVHIPNGITTTTGNMVAGTRTITNPTGMLEPRALAVTNGSGQAISLKFKDASFIDEVWPVAANTAFPQFYAVNDDGTIYVAPTPDDTYAYSLRWYGVGDSVVDLGDDNNTSWLSVNAEALLLYACLYEGYVYMKGAADLLAEYKAQYESELERFKAQMEGIATHDAFESGVPRLLP